MPYMLTRAVNLEVEEGYLYGLLALAFAILLFARKVSTSFACLLSGLVLGTII